MLINSYSFPPKSYRVPVTIPSGKVASNLTNFPVYVNLSNMPAAFWSHVASKRGFDIRVKDGSGNSIPFDLFMFNPVAKTGGLFAKVTLSSASSTTFYIHYGDYTLNSKLAYNDASYGRNLVWSDYHRVFLFGEDFQDHTGNGTDLKQTSLGWADPFTLVSTSANLGVHQGVEFDGTYYYLFGTNVIKKYDSSLTLVTTNSNPVGDVGNSTNHVGDGCVAHGMIYVPVENYTNETTFSNQRIARFRASDLSFINSVSVSAQGHEVASVCYNDSDGYLYVASYGDGSKLWKYNADTLAYVGSLTLSSTITHIQGITYWREAFWITSDDNDCVIRVGTDGTVGNRVYDQPSSGNWEGIGHTDDALIVLHDTTGTGTGVIKTLKARTLPGSSIACAEFNQNGNKVNDGYFADGLTKLTSWTMGVTVQLQAKGVNNAVFSYESEATGAVNTERGTLAFRNSSDRFGVWNSTDGWLFQDALGSPALNTTYRFNYTHDGTSTRKLFYNGGNVASSSPASQRPGGTSPSRIWIGIENSAQNEEFSGLIGFVYVRSGTLSNDWVAAEYSNLNQPSSFYNALVEE